MAAWKAGDCLAAAAGHVGDLTLCLET